MEQNQQQQNNKQNYRQQQTRGRGNDMDVKEFVREHTAIDVTRPANSLKNFFLTIPFAIALILGIQVDGNPLSKFTSSLGVGVRRAWFSTGNEITPQMTDGVNAVYGKGSQQATDPRFVKPANQDGCEQRGEWLYCPNGNRN